MIKYNLKCENNHDFESWFSSSVEFDNLSKKKLLECIYCSSKNIKKSIMALMVSLVNDKKNELNQVEQRNKIQNNLYAKKFNQLASTFIANLRKNANIKYFNK